MNLSDSNGGRPAATSLRARHREQTLAIITRAAIAEIGRLGVDATTMDEIARVAGVSRATLYAHFPTRHLLLEAVADHIYEVGRQIYGSFADVDEWSELPIRRWLAYVLERWSNDLDLVRVAIQLQGRSPGDVDARRHDGLVDALLGEATGGWGRIRPGQRRLRALILVASLEMVLTAHLVHEWRADTDDVLDVLAQTWSMTLNSGHAA